MTQPDTVRIQGPDGVITLPVYDPGTLSSPQLRIAMPDGTVGAFRLEQNPASDPAYRVRVGIGGTVYAIDTQTATVLEDFEDGAWPDDWTNETQYYDLTTTAITGSYSLEATSSDFQQVANPNLSTPRGYSYAMRAVPAGASGQAWLLVCVQDATNATQDAYAARLRPDTDEIEAMEFANGNVSSLAQASVSLSYSTEYRVVLDADTDQIQARVLDSSGSELAATGWASTTTHTDGYIGVYTGGSDSDGSRYDDFTRHPLGGV